MARIQVKVGTRYVYQNEVHRITKQLADDHFRICNIRTGDEKAIHHDEILTAWSNGELRFEVMGRTPTKDEATSLLTHPGANDLDELTPPIQEETWRRYELVLAVYRYHQVKPGQMLSRRQIEDFLNDTEQSDKSNLPSAFSIERYMQSFVESGGDIRSLVPRNRRRGGRGQSRLDEPVEQIVAAVLEKYAEITERISTVDQVMTDILNATADENQFRDAHSKLMPPSERTIRRRIKAVGEKRILGRRLSRREQKAESETQQGIRPTRILERVEIDHATLNLFVVDEKDGLPIGRPYITACIDKYSALAPGWHISFNNGGYESIMLCLQHAILPKPDYRELYGTEHNYPVYGLFEKLCIDNGRDFKSANLKNALATLGIIRERMPPETPWFKGSIERYFRSVNQRLLKGKPGYTFSDVVTLGDYDAQKDAVISLSAFIEIFHIFMVDIYPYSWHKGIEAIPMERWQENEQVFMPVLFENATELKRILLPSAERVLQAKGIEWANNFYRGTALARLRELHGKEKVRFKYNPDDINVIYVRDDTAATGWAEFHSSNPDYTSGLSLAKHKVIRQYVNAQKQGVDRFSLARAKAHIQKVIEREFLTTKKLRRRSRLKPLLQPETQLKAKPQSKPEVTSSQKSVLKEADENDLSPDWSGWSSDYDLPISGKDEQ